MRRFAVCAFRRRRNRDENHLLQNFRHCPASAYVPINAHAHSEHQTLADGHDIFRRDPNGPVWLEARRNPQNARARVQDLAAQNSGECFFVLDLSVSEGRSRQEEHHSCWVDPITSLVRRNTEFAVVMSGQLRIVRT